MKIVWSWLCELVSLPAPLTAQEGAAVLTSIGLEVEQTSALGAGFDGAVVAEVLAMRPHPKADKLRIVTVRDSPGGAGIEVVCGAPNVPPAGHFVVWARPGARVGDAVLAPKEIKGVLSPGMLCGETELGIGDDDSGIIVLKPDSGVVAGQDAKTALGVDDFVLDVNVPANRADCLGHLGVARELAARQGGTLVSLPSLTPSRPLPASPGAVRVEDATDCALYTARHIHGVAAVPSPRVIQQRLRAMGVRPKNVLVDVTNYVMFETGQPLHAFDAAALKGQPLVVRRARIAERLVTLDGVERALASDIVVAAGEEPVALAGVMGGANSEVNESTTQIVLEAAHFSPTLVRATRTRLAMPSEASQRFERGVDVHHVEAASARAAYLLERYGGATVFEASVVGAPPEQGPPIRLPLAKLRQLTGVAYEAQEIEALLARLGMQAHRDGDAFVVARASWRPDVARDVDLIEEILRHGGLDRVPATLPAMTATPTRPRDDLAGILRDELVAAGLCEAITFGFLSEQRLGWMGDPSLVARAIPVTNPMTQDQGLMRTHLLPNLLAGVARNEAHQVRDIALFEVGSVFLRAESEVAPSPVRTLGTEPLHLACVLTGRHWSHMKTSAPWDYFDAKNLVVRVAERAGIEPMFMPTTEVAYLHPGVGAHITYAAEGGVRSLGYVGELHPDVRERAGIAGQVFIIALDLSGLAPRALVQYAPIPRFPATSRDMSLLVKEDLLAADMRRVLAAAAMPLVEGMELLEEYRDAKLPAGTKSMLWSVQYRAPDRTLTEKEVELAHQALLEAVSAQLGAIQR